MSHKTNRVDLYKNLNDLQQFNARFSNLIDHRLDLNDENNNNILQHNQIIDNLRDLYQKELDENKLLIQELSYENAKLKISMEKCQAQLKDTQEMCTMYSMQNEQLKDQLGGETLNRIDCENKLICLKEELDFKMNIAEKEIEFLKNVMNESKRQSKDYLRLSFADELNKLRNQFEVDYVRMRDVWETDSKRKIDEAKETIESLKKTCKFYTDQDYDLTIQQLKEQIKNQKSQITILKRERDEFKIEICKRDAEIDQLRDDLYHHNELNEDYIAQVAQLSHEITRYKSVLSDEEKRLNDRLNGEGTKKRRL